MLDALIIYGLYFSVGTLILVGLAVVYDKVEQKRQKDWNDDDVDAMVHTLGLYDKS